MPIHISITKLIVITRPTSVMCITVWDSFIVIIIIIIIIILLLYYSSFNYYLHIIHTYLLIDSSSIFSCFVFLLQFLQ